MEILAGMDYLLSMLQPKRCAVCESEELSAYPLDIPDQLDKWNFLLADKVVYCCSNGHRFVVLPDESKRAESLL
jgi:hypothetical protein